MSKTTLFEVPYLVPLWVFALTWSDTVDQARPYHGTPKISLDGDTRAAYAFTVSARSYAGPDRGSMEPA